jgi:DNA processing protein
MPSRRNADAEACLQCLRRSWLLSASSAVLDYHARNQDRLIDLLALADEQMIAALGGRRREQLRRRYAAFDRDDLPRAGDAEMICRHHAGYPRALNVPIGPHMLHLAGSLERFIELAAAPVVAIVGSRQASDYGMEVARGLARGLAASGVTIAGALADGIATAAHAGAHEVGGGTLAVSGDGLAACRARRRARLERVRGTGCAVSELPGDCTGRRWGMLASERVTVGLAALTVVVEAEQTPRDMAAAAIARALGRTVAAVPGRLTSPLSQGTHALLLDGARLLRGTEDALELLYRIRGAKPCGSRIEESRLALEPRLQRTLERVGAGSDTPQSLAREGEDMAATLLALSELELMGLLTRGDGGRYLPCSLVGQLETTRLCEAGVLKHGGVEADAIV